MRTQSRIERGDDPCVQSGTVFQKVSKITVIGLIFFILDHYSQQICLGYRLGKLEVMWKSIWHFNSDFSVNLVTQKTYAAVLTLFSGSGRDLQCSGILTFQGTLW